MSENLGNIVNSNIFIALLTFLLGIITAIVTIRLQKRHEVKNAEKEKREKIADLIVMKQKEIDYATKTLKQALFDNYFSFTHKDVVGQALVNSGKLYIPHSINIAGLELRELDLVAYVSKGIALQLKEFCNAIKEFESKSQLSQIETDIVDAFPYIVKIADTVILGNEIYYQLDWALRELIDPKSIEAYKRSGVQQFSGTYEGTWAVPWLEPPFAGDDPVSNMHRKFGEARERFTRDGICYSADGSRRLS